MNVEIGTVAAHFRYWFFAVYLGMRTSAFSERAAEPSIPGTEDISVVGTRNLGVTVISRAIYTWDWEHQHCRDAQFGCDCAQQSYLYLGLGLFTEPVSTILPLWRRPEEPSLPWYWENQLCLKALPWGRKRLAKPSITDIKNIHVFRKRNSWGEGA